MTEYYLAVDIGASSGRHILGHLEDGRMVLEEVYRFPNGMKETHGHLCWDTDELFSHIKEGMKRCKAAGQHGDRYLGSGLCISGSRGSGGR